MTSVVEPIFYADASLTDLPTALQLMSGLSRNQFLVHALDAREQLLGEIEVKGGMVLRAQVGDLGGREAVFALMNLRPQTLSAYHCQGGDLGEPLGSLERLLMEGAVVIDELSREPEPVLVQDQPPLSEPGTLETQAPTPASAEPPVQTVSPQPIAGTPVQTPAQPMEPWLTVRVLPWGLAAVSVALLFHLLRRR